MNLENKFDDKHKANNNKIEQLEGTYTKIDATRVRGYKPARVRGYQIMDETTRDMIYQVGLGALAAALFVGSVIAYREFISPADNNTQTQSVSNEVYKR